MEPVARLLLDTHLVLWWLSADRQLAPYGPTVRLV